MMMIMMMMMIVIMTATTRLTGTPRRRLGLVVQALRPLCDLLIEVPLVSSHRIGCLSSPLVLGSSRGGAVASMGAPSRVVHVRLDVRTLCVPVPPPRRFCSRSGDTGGLLPSPRLGACCTQPGHPCVANGKGFVAVAVGGKNCALCRVSLIFLVHAGHGFACHIQGVERET